jgi:WD40 repeat protein
VIRALFLAGLVLADVTPRGDPFRAETARLLTTMQLGRAPVATFTYTRDARRIVILSADGNLSLWDAATRKEIRSAEGAFFNSRLVLNASGTRALGPGTDRRSLRLVDVERGKQIRIFADAQAAFPQTYALSPDGHRAVFVRRDQAVVACDAATGENEKILIEASTGQCGSLAWSPDGKQIVVYGWDFNIRFLDAKTGDVTATVPDGGRGAYFVGYSPNSSTIVVVTHENRMRILDRNGRDVRTLDETIGGTRFVAFSPDGLLMAACEIGGKTRIWETRTWKPVRDLSSGLVRHLGFSPDGRHLLLGAMDGTLHVWGGYGPGGGAPKEEPVRPGAPAFLGISAETAEDEAGGVVVDSIIDGTAAQKAGLKAGDRITRIGTTATDSFETLRTLVGSLREGDEVEVVYKRDGVEKKVKLKLGARPADE